MTLNKKNILIIILIVGFILRLAVILNNGFAPNYDSPAGTDEVNYRELARNIYENKILGSWSEGFFTRSIRAPVYPALLAFAKFAAGSNSYLFINLVCDTLNIFLVYLLACILFGHHVGIISSGLYAVFAPSFIYLRFTTPEIFAVTLILLFLILFYRYEKIATPVFFAMIIFYSLLIHTRPSFLPLTVLLPLIFWIKFCDIQNLRERILLSLIPCLLIFLFTLPWTIRNYKIQKAIIPVIVIPAWHTFEAEKTESTLSADKVLDVIYAPERKGWTEGEYYVYGCHESAKVLKKYHIKIFIAGAIRILKSWCFPDFYKRFYLLKAYFNPIYIYKENFIILPDFEGIVYLSFFIFLFAIFAKGLAVLSFCKNFVINNLEMIIFLVGYIGAHIIAIPFPQYRFLVEPLIVILLIGFCERLFGTEKEYSLFKENTDFRKIDYALILGAGFLLFLIFLPLVLPFKNKKITYPKLSDDSKYQSYDNLREMQWQNRGFVRANPEAFIAGRIRYLAKGYRFLEKGISPAEKNNDWSLGKLFVEENSPHSPLGKGDIKLNFNTNSIPNENEYIICRGTISNGIFRDLILNVKNWEKINEN